ncbi:MAG TPA: bifunctional phosphopantothenoylcysteine decarboxylase/phosphopantothenate--cysteine ligase CoaBC [Thermoanaerobaculia bacterium]|nr:bifunctional phosphopantothenoylcysteine decarboxylase/phosphopantothenate--cysteine ligase CoaBC [Thermoanaerobaculia bacterium]
MNPRIVLGVSGGIAAYKAAELLRRLTERGAEVQVVMTRGAREFVAPLTFATLSRRPVHTEVWGDGNTPAVSHVELADWADLLVIAPATAHTIGKLARGLADDFLSTYFLAHRGPVLLAPAMETAMWESAAVAENIRTLATRGVRFVGPAAGSLASGHEGLGRMAEPEAIAAEAWRILERGRDLAGQRLLVTAGPTREPLDPIRFLSNRSSGKMGYALAEAARDRGASVTLLSGHTDLPRPHGVRFERFETAADLHGLLVREFPECDGLAMAAAVADFIPESSPERMHREDGDRSVRLAAGRDILASLAPLRRGQTVIAFAAETEDLEERGLRKLEAKGADLVVVNDVGRPGIGFDAEENEVVILTREGSRETVSRRPKREVADKIWDAFLVRRKSIVHSR